MSARRARRVEKEGNGRRDLDSPGSDGSKRYTYEVYARCMFPYVFINDELCVCMCVCITYGVVHLTQDVRVGLCVQVRDARMSLLLREIVPLVSAS